MPDRRTTLKLGATGLLGSLVNLPSQAFANTANTKLLNPSHALINSDYNESRAFAAALRNKNILVSDIKQDLSKLWYGSLRQQLLNDPTPIIGLTDRRELFCLEELARDVGMKVTLRFDHLIDEKGYIEHQLNGLAINELGHSSGFGAEMAEVSLLSQTSNISAQKITGPYAPKNKTALVTWIIS